MKNTIMAEKINLEDPSIFEISALVKSASAAIPPLGPIRTFAARSPWLGLEDQSFEKIARKLKDLCDIDLYPNESIFQTAFNQGEINRDFLEKSLQEWLDLQAFEMPREVAEAFCRAALMKEKPPGKLFNTTELKNEAKKLSGFKSLFQRDGVKMIVQRLEDMAKKGLVNELNRQLIKWCKLFLDESQAVWSMPNRERGFYHTWRDLAPFDSSTSHSIRKQVKNLPNDAALALKEGLAQLNIPFQERKRYLEAHLLALPGWAGMMLWHTQESDWKNSLLIDYLAVRISMELLLVKPYLPLPKLKREGNEEIEKLMAAWAKWGDLPVQSWQELSFSQQKAHLILSFRFDSILRKRLWLEAWEKSYESQLKNMILPKATKTNDRINSLVQFAFCLDVRSEPFRRILEKTGPFETFGTAGFFGLPVETRSLEKEESHRSHPVMLKPKFEIKESATEWELKKFQDRSHVIHSVKRMVKELKFNLSASFILPEISGPWLGLHTLARSFMPQRTGSFLQKLNETWLHKPSSKLELDRVKHVSKSGLPIGLSEKEKIYYARQALTMMGLTEYFAPLVVICGHGSHSINNPYASALDCGACGGASGGMNARILANLCNLPSVREGLEKEGIFIPVETVFAAAEHLTAVDELKWIDVPELSPSAKKAYDQIQSCLPKISKEANRERLKHFGELNETGKKSQSKMRRRSEDWSEIRPEWGLARNAALVIGERRLTKECNLDGRVFLHDYNWKKDLNNDLLVNIVNGPGLVAQWINLQYYASTVAPHYYGSGNKATQTVTAGIGVMQGNASDLLMGLPWQSVMKSDQEVHHVPLRLLVVIQAPKQSINQLLKQVPAFYQKVKNGWIRLASIGPEGNWTSWS